MRVLDTYYLLSFRKKIVQIVIAEEKIQISMMYMNLSLSIHSWILHIYWVPAVCQALGIIIFKAKKRKKLGFVHALEKKCIIHWKLRLVSINWLEKEENSVV